MPSRGIHFDERRPGRLKPSPGGFFGTPMLGLLRWRVSFFDERITGFELGEQRKIPVSSPKFAHAVMEAECGDARIVDAGAGQSGGGGDFRVAG